MSIYDYPIGTVMGGKWSDPLQCEVVGYTPKGRLILSRFDIDHEWCIELDSVSNVYEIVSRPTQGNLPIV